MGQFQDASIKDVVKNLNQRYFLPDVQREYVWLSNAKERKIEDLFDSLLRGYPIGTFLFWKLKKTDIETSRDADESSGKLNFQLYKFIEKYDERKKHNEKVNIEQIDAEDLSIVLDGQQRLTSLYIGLKGSRTLKRPRAWSSSTNAFEEKHLYLNLRYFPSEESPEGNDYKFEFLLKDKTPGSDAENYWFRVGEILELESIIAYAREHNLSDKEAKILEKLKNAFCTERLISYFEESEKNLDKVLKIFIRVNSGGTQLSYSDLLMSILTATFSTDIRGEMNEFVDWLDDQGFGVMGRDQVLKTCLLLTESNHVFKLKNFNKHNIRKIETDWGKIKHFICSGVKMLSDFGYTNHLSSAYILSVVSYYLSRQGKITNKDKKQLLRFVQAVQIKGYFNVSLDARLEVIAKILRNPTNFSDVNDTLFASASLLKISDEEIDSIMDEREYRHSSILPILQLLYPNLDYSHSHFHIDHVYPKSKFNSNDVDIPEDCREKLNCLYNLQLLPGEHNLNKSDKDPEVWLNEHFNGDKAQINAYKNSNYIDENLTLSWENISDFKSMRTKKMAIRLKEILLTPI